MTGKIPPLKQNSNSSKVTGNGAGSSTDAPTPKSGKLGTWEKVKLSIIEDLRREIAESDTPSIADTMEFIFIEDPSLEGASIEELQHRFQAWAEAHPDYVYYEGRSRSRATRFNFFLKADAELMRRGDLGLVQGWPYAPGEEDWIRIDDGDVSTHLYVELDNTEMWYIYYTEPSGYAHIH